MKHILNYAPYKVGDILYVRETWLKADDGYYYMADETQFSKELRNSYEYKWKPSIHMPKSAARIFLKVTDVRVERLQDITEEQAKAESFEKREVFLDYWDELVYENDKTRFKTSENYSKYNPWVFPISFERIDKPKKSEGE
jgi:hypothetical protein